MSTSKAKDVPVSDPFRYVSSQQQVGPKMFVCILFKKNNNVAFSDIPYRIVFNNDSFLFAGMRPTLPPE